MSESVTCGNCAEVVREIHKVRCPHRRYLSEKMVEWQGVPLYEHCSSDDACECFESRTDTLEQRFRQLGEVARDLYAAVRINEQCSSEFIADNGDCGHFRRLLESLGVSLDGRG